MGKVGQGRTRRQRRAARTGAGPGGSAGSSGRGTAEWGPARQRPADRAAIIVSRLVLVGLGGAVLVLPWVTPDHPGRPAPDGWIAAIVICTWLFLMLGLLVVLPIGLIKPRLGPGPVLTVTTVRGCRHVRLDALTRVAAVDFSYRTSALYVRLHDADGRWVVPVFGRDVPRAVVQAAASLAGRDPRAVTSRARDHLGLPGAPGLGRRMAQAVVTSLVFIVVTFGLLGLAVGYAFSLT